MARGKGYTLLLTPTEAVLEESQTQVSAQSSAFGPFQNPLIATKTSRGSVIRMQLVGANSAPAMTGLEELPGKVNYLIGNDSSKWQTEVPLYSQARAEQVYLPGGMPVFCQGWFGQSAEDVLRDAGLQPAKTLLRSKRRILTSSLPALTFRVIIPIHPSIRSGAWKCSRGLAPELR